MPDPLKKRHSSQLKKMDRSAAVASLEAPRDAKAFLDHTRLLTNRRFEVLALREQELRLAADSSQEIPEPKRKRIAHLKALKSWHATASAQLEHLRNGRTGANEDSRPIPEADHPQALQLMRRLIVGLSKNSSQIATLASGERRWHIAAKAAREGIKLRTRTAREVLGNSLRPDPQLHLKLAHATFMLEGNSPRLRSDLAAAAVEAPQSKAIAYWRARYALMVGHYSAAHEAITSALDYAPIRHDLLPMLDPESAKAPWLSWPCNFYTYRYTLATNDQLMAMQSALAGLTNNPTLEDTWKDVYHFPESAIQLLKSRAVSAGQAINCLLLWNQGNSDIERGKYSSAARNYEDCQRAIVAYFKMRYPSLNFSVPSPRDESGSNIVPQQQLISSLDELANKLVNYAPLTRQIWTFFRERLVTATLDELNTHDWRRPHVVPLAYDFADPLPDYGDKTDGITALMRILIQMSILRSLQISGEKVEEKIDAPLLAIALVFCPMANAEANRQRRNFDDALTQCKQLLSHHRSYSILSEIIEKPFVKILKAQILLDKADSEYKARTLSTTPALNPDNSLKYQGLTAAETYQGVLVAFEDQGQYVNRVNSAVATVNTELSSLLSRSIHPATRENPAAPDVLSPAERAALELVGKRISIETIEARAGAYPEPDRRVRPHESLIRFEAPANEQVMGETNPLIYALIVQARARLLQMESGLNYLGYRDDYAPPWRFQFLLDRARYFAEHSKNAQRDYLNFLGNAEREEFQELSAAQNVELEKANIRVETARVDQSKLELESAKASEELSQLNAFNAQRRLDNYEDFDKFADDLFDTVHADPTVLISDIANLIPGVNPIFTGIGDFFSGGAVSNRKQVLVADQQRNMEKKNLQLSVLEAQQGEIIAQRQLEVSKAALQVAGMQRAVAVLRHEFAIQNLSFMRNRTLNAELWYRLAAAMRGVSDTYLRYGIELGFLAEQAYEFEADKRINVIRFDYDASEMGNMLAGDFLLRDLDTLEQDLIVGQTIRQQQVRYVLSLAREFPGALQELRENNRMTFGLRLEQLERRFPGLFNLRINSVEVLPIALMDNSRFALEMTHLGTGSVRLKTQSTDDTENLVDDWLIGLEESWSIKSRTTGPESAIFSGLTKQDLSSTFFAANQRGAFEGLAGASSWRMDLSMKENRIVPDSLADLLITFTLSGYYDATLKAAIERTPRRALSTTSWFSGHRDFPDRFYEFNRSGRLTWDVTPDFFSLQAGPGELKNLGMILLPSQKRPDLGRLMCSYPVAFTVDAAGTVEILRNLPEFTLSANGLEVNATIPSGAVVTFDFGDGTGLVDGGALPHTYARPGRYDVLIRIAKEGRLTEYRASLVVSRQFSVAVPCIAMPQLTATVSGDHLKVQPSLISAESLDVTWRVNNGAPDPDPGPITFTLSPGRHLLHFVAVRPLTVRFHSQQCFDPEETFVIERLNLATNRTFDLDGVETTTGLNALGHQLFDGGPIVASDRWTMEIPQDGDLNLCTLSVSSGDVKQYDLSELSDVVLALENDVV